MALIGIPSNSVDSWVLRHHHAAPGLDLPALPRVPSLAGRPRAQYRWLARAGPGQGAKEEVNGQAVAARFGRRDQL